MSRNVRNSENSKFGKKSPDGRRKFKWITKVILTKWRGWRKWRIWQNSPLVWKTFKLNDKSGLLESGDHDENGECDENSESRNQWRKIARGLAKILIRLEGVLLAKTKNWRNGESDKNGESGKKIYHGFNKYSSWGAKSDPLESGEFDENGEQGENDEFGDNSPKMQ